MSITYTTNLGLGVPATGTESGVWGDVVNNSLTAYLDNAIAGGLSISITTSDVTLANTNGTSTATNISSTTAQYAILNISGAKTGNRNLNLPASSRHYIINNAGTGGYVLTVRGAGPTTGVTLVDGETAVVAWTGTDYVKIASTPFNMGVGGGSTYANTVYGKGALANVTTGNTNVAIGINALAANTAGAGNVAINAALQGLTGSTATSNIGIGLRAAAFSSGSWNIALGQDAMNGAITSITENIAIGLSSMQGANGAIGDQNVALGSQALYGIRTGARNVAIGADALKNLTTGSANIAISPKTSSNTYAPVFDPTTQSDRVCMGSTAVTNAYIQVAWTVVSDARDKTDFASVPHGLAFVNSLKPIAYRYRVSRESDEAHGPVRYGFKAQEVMEAEGDSPVIVDAEDPEKLRFNDQSMIAVLVNAIKEQTQIIKVLSDRVAALEAR